MIHFLTLLFPRRCVVCDKVVRGEERICQSCREIPEVISGENCIICGKPLKMGNIYCKDCQKRYHYFRKNISVFTYDSMRKSIYRFKYGGRCEYAEYYAMITYLRYREEIESWNADAIVPVPLHKERYRKRGYNQAEEFGRALSQFFSIPLKTDFVKRQKKTKPMKLLSRLERQNNLKKAFLIAKNDVKLNTIILVDDIYTTGTTLDCISMVCMSCGVKNIYAITIAIGSGN